MAWHLKLYCIGIGLMLLLILAGEMIWLLDPIRAGSRLYAIDLLEYGWYLLAVVPLLWLISAIRGFRVPMQSSLALLRLFIIASSAGALYFIGTKSHQWLSLMGFMLLAFVLVVVDYNWSKGLVGRGRLRQSLMWTGLWLGIIMLLLCPTGYRVTYPGLTVNMNHYAHIEQGKQHGEVMGVLVFDRPAFPMDHLLAMILPYYHLEIIEPSAPSIDEQLRTVRASKVSANDMATAYALHKIGAGQGLIYQGVRVISVMDGSPASERLYPDDIIKAVNGRPVAATDAFLAEMNEIRPGETLVLELRRSNNTLTVNIETIPHPAASDRAILGIQIADHINLDIPLNVQFRNYILHEGGPSHGAMLALSLLDQLTPGGVTYGNITAGTGTIRMNGEIGPIGGMKQKAVTVARTDADVFFVPADQLAEAKQGADQSQLTIVPVRTLDDILQWLQQHPKN